MDRRNFLHTLSVLGATTILPAPAISGGALTTAASNLAMPPPTSKSVFEIANEPLAPRVGVIAIGGHGGAVLSNLFGKLPYLNRSIAIDVNPAALHGIAADHKILVADQGPDWWSNAPARMMLANDLQIQLAEAIANLDIAFLVVEMGGVASSFIAPVAAEVLRESPVITFGAAITPFIFEGPRRERIALAGTHALSRMMNLVFPISNELQAQSARHRKLQSASSTALFDRLYRSAILPIAEPGLVNFDAESIRLITSKNGQAAMGYGDARGADAEETAARRAIGHPSLGVRRLRSASGILFSVEGSPTALAKLGPVCRIVKTIRKTIGDVDHEQIIFFGANKNETLVDEFRVTILAGGIQSI